MFDFLMYGFQKNAVFVLSKNKVPPPQKKKLLKYKKIGAKRPNGIRGNLSPCPTGVVTK